MKPVNTLNGSKDHRWRRLASKTRPHATIRWSARALLAAAVLMPAAIITISLGEPFAISAIASTVAIVLHNPQRYHQRPQPILSCYAFGIIVSAMITLADTTVDLPPLLASGIAAIIIAASPAGRIHPPTACIPLQITAAIEPLALLGRWLTFTGLSLGCLAALWLLTARPLVRYTYTDRHTIQTPSATM